MNESPCVILQVLLSCFSRTKFKLEKLVDWLGAETNDLGDDRRTHTSPDNATVHTLNGYTCWLVYFRWLINLLIPTLWLKPNGFEYQVLAHDLNLSFTISVPGTCHGRVSVKIWLTTATLLLCVFSSHSLFSLGPQTQTQICTFYFLSSLCWCWYHKVWRNKHVNVLQVNLGKRRTSLTLQRTGTQPCGCGTFQVFIVTPTVLSNQSKYVP